MKKGRFLWSAHRITERQKAGKARSIKGKQLKNSRNTVSKQLVELHSSQRDNLSRTKISRKTHFTRVTGVVECCQMCWNLHRMQHICSRYATNILICIGHFSVEILGNVLFARFYKRCSRQWIYWDDACINRNIFAGWYSAPARHEQDCFAICEWHRLIAKFD